MSASFKKAQKAKQRPHRERGQLKERESLGLLEKKKDYRIRARHHKKKQDNLKILHKKALEKNPDEFYHKMIHKKLKNGEHALENPNAHTETDEQIKLIASQDIKYIHSRLQMERKKIEKLKNVLNFPTKPANKRIIFVDSKQEKSQLKSKLSLCAKNDTIIGEDLPKDIKEYREKQKEELEQRKKRYQELKAVAEKLELRQKLSSNSKVPSKMEKKATKTGAAVYKWEAVRYK